MLLAACWAFALPWYAFILNVFTLHSSLVLTPLSLFSTFAVHFCQYAVTMLEGYLGFLVNSIAEEFTLRNVWVPLW